MRIRILVILAILAVGVLTTASAQAIGAQESIRIEYYDYTAAPGSMIVGPALNTNTDDKTHYWRQAIAPDTRVLQPLFTLNGDALWPDVHAPVFLVARKGQTTARWDWVSADKPDVPLKAIVFRVKVGKH